MSQKFHNLSSRFSQDDILLLMLPIFRTKAISIGAKARSSCLSFISFLKIIIRFFLKWHSLFRIILFIWIKHLDLFWWLRFQRNRGYNKQNYGHNVGLKWQVFCLNRHVFNDLKAITKIFFGPVEIVIIKFVWNCNYKPSMLHRHLKIKVESNNTHNITKKIFSGKKLCIK